jgi:hypothetical protein
MSADVPGKEVLDQAGVLAGWLLENEQWRPYRGSAEIAQCSHPDRGQRVKPVIDAMNVVVYPYRLLQFMPSLIAISRPRAKLPSSSVVEVPVTHSSNQPHSKRSRERF